ncbi:transposase family protein [Streptomyces chartreusis]|uniref:transposase family protein n=1 Tax=Streptomyces chartreusis TaxID=1969 RepID=UPI003D8E89A3
MHERCTARTHRPGQAASPAATWHPTPAASSGESFCSPAEPASCADSTHARKVGRVKLLDAGPAVEILADAGYQGLGAQTAGRLVTPPHRKFKKNPPEWYEGMHERQRKAHSSRRIRFEHGIGHLKNWRSLGRHEHMSDIIQAVAGLLSHQVAPMLAHAQPALPRLA